MTNSKIKYKLKGHGTFIIRDGWINKGLQYVSKDNTLFRAKKAADCLGVGNNMAQAIRYWLKACELMEESSQKGALLTNLGKEILQHDPYLEDDFTLWILHCNLVTNEELATVWHLFFNYCDIDENTREEIYIQLERELNIYIKNEDFSKSSLKDDILALTNMYARVKHEDIDPEDNTVSPFTVLSLLKEQNHLYTKVQPNLKTLDEKVVLYMLLKQMKGEKSISIDKLLVEKNSMGRVLNLTRISINQYLDKLESDKYIVINRTAGLDVVYRNCDMTPLEVIKAYYSDLME